MNKSNDNDEDEIMAKLGLRARKKEAPVFFHAPAASSL